MAIKWAQNPPLAALLLAAFLSRALIPAGFMPGSGGLVICPGYAPVPGAAAIRHMSHGLSAMEMAGMDMSGMDMAHQAGHPSKDGGSPDHEGSSLCPFAAAAVAMVSGHLATLVSVNHVVTPRVDLPSQLVVPRGTIVPTSLPRGPPSLA
jgi:hypothetical protein